LKMRILFINTHDKRGGAAVVAQRLRMSLENQYSADCFHLVAYKLTSDEKTFSTRNWISSFVENVINRFCNKIGAQYQFFPFSAATILRKIKQLAPDVISLHNTHGGYFPTPLLQKISELAPIVWTLHDMWSFTGNAAHTFGDESWKQLRNSGSLISIYPSIGINTGKYLLRQKQRIYSNSNITIATPSKWLYTLANQSPVFKTKKVVHINNGVDINIF
jgi:glycosyltransferase involved in cell wall biosynthesis